MEITLELVERLREKAGVSYGQAKEALEYSGGNLLDALIYLEETGAIPRTESAYYSTRSEAPPPSPPADPLPAQPPGRESKQEAGAASRPGQGGLRRFFLALRRWLIDNELEIWRHDQPITALPVLILLLLLCSAPYLTIPALLVGLFLGFRYRFSGPDLEREGLNGVIGGLADTAADLGRHVMDELRSQHDKHGKDGDGR